MPQIIQDTNGNDIEVFTAEELNQQKEAVRVEIENKIKDQVKEKETQKETADEQIDNLKKEVQEKIETAKKEVLDGVMKDYYTENINALAGEDEDLKKKIEYEYNRLNDAATTKEEVIKKIRDAWYQATKPEDLGALNSAVVSSGGVSPRFQNTSGSNKFTPEEKAFAQKLADAGGIKLEEKHFK